MRARSALALAALLALPMLLVGAPRDDAPLASHALGGALSAQIETVLGRVAPPAAGLPAGVMPAPGSGPVAPAGQVQVHWLAGERTFATWVVPGVGEAVDLDGDGAAELRVDVSKDVPRALTVSGLGPTDVAWAAWLDQDGARVGLTGAGRAPPAAMAALRDGDLRLQVRGATHAWHAAFAYAGEAKRTVAWLHEPGARADLEAFVGLGYLARVPAGAHGGLRLLLVDGERTHDLVLRDVPPGAQVAREVDGALRYRAPRAGGALAYSGDADAVGQRGDLAFDAESLPDSLVVAPAGPGFVVEASKPTDVLLDWKPPGGSGLRFVGNDIQRIEAEPGAAGGVLLRGPQGQVAVLRPTSGDQPEVLQLGAQGVAVAPASPLLPALLAVILGGIIWWALRAPKAKAA